MKLEPELIGVREAAAMLGIHHQTLRAMTAKGRGPKNRMFGGKRVFRPSDVRAFIDAMFDDAPQSVAQ